MIEFTSSEYLILFGPPRQRGRIHGETFRTKIHELMCRWKDWLALTTGLLPDRYLQDFINETNFQTTIQKWTPGLLDEVKGIAEGANVNFNDIYAFQLLDEEWWYGLQRKQIDKSPMLHCSSLGWIENTTIIAQNMDLPDFLDGYQIVLHITDPQFEYEALVFSTVGLLGLNGINNHSIGIVCNNLWQLNHSAKGLPVAFVIRGILEKTELSEAEFFIKSIPHASGQNYILGGEDIIKDFECSADKVVMYIQPNRKNSICHTNHPFVNTDFRDIMRGTKSYQDNLETYLDENDDSSTRFHVVYQQIGKSLDDSSNVETAKKILQSHESKTYPVCRHSTPESPWMTLGTSIMDLSADPKFQVCPGPPCSSIFSSYDFQKTGS